MDPERVGVVGRCRRQVPLWVTLSAAVGGTILVRVAILRRMLSDRGRHIWHMRFGSTDER
jgi:hypothetical protein